VATNGVCVACAAHSAEKAGARLRACTMETFSCRISATRRAALPSMVSGFLVCTGICASRPPSASSRAAMRPPRVATRAVPPARTTAWATSIVLCSAPPVSSSGMTCSRVK
jgi:hypothetical protein